MVRVMVGIVRQEILHIKSRDFGNSPSSNDPNSMKLHSAPNSPCFPRLSSATDQKPTLAREPSCQQKENYTHSG